MKPLSPQMERLLSLMGDGEVVSAWSIQERFYGFAPGAHGYVNAGRGHGTGALLQSFKALERRGLVRREGHGWVKEQR